MLFSQVTNKDKFSLSFTFFTKHVSTMDASWQVLIGTGIASGIIAIIALYRTYLRESKAIGESQKLAKWSIIISLSGIILIGIGSIIGIILGIVSMKGKKLRALSWIGIILGAITLLPWLAVMIFGQ